MSKAIRIHTHGDPSVMVWEDVPSGEPAPGQVLLRHTAVGLNYVDVYFRTSNRMLALMIPKERERTFPIRLPARPPVSDTYSRWVPAHALDASRGISEDFDVRYRVVDPVVSPSPK